MRAVLQRRLITLARGDVIHVLAASLELLLSLLISGTVSFVYYFKVNVLLISFFDLDRLIIVN